MVGLISLVAYLSQLNNDTVRTISVLDESGLFLNQFEDDQNLKFQMITDVSLEAAKKSAEEEEIYGLLFIPKIDSIEQLSEAITFYDAQRKRATQRSPAPSS